MGKCSNDLQFQKAGSVLEDMVEEIRQTRIEQYENILTEDRISIYFDLFFKKILLCLIQVKWTILHIM